MGKVFLSHSSAQKYLVEKVADRIGKQICFYDKYSIETGSQTISEIINGLDKTDIFVLFISEEALNSSWVALEINKAKVLLSLLKIKQLFPIIVDDKIKYDDKRIPSWLQEEYNLQLIKEPYLIVNKIEQQRREIQLNNNELLRKKEELFVGRNLLIEEVEDSLNSLRHSIPTVIIASGINGVGRRTLLKHGLFKADIIKKIYLPKPINLEFGSSIEDFIVRIQDVSGNDVDKVISNLKLISINEKVNIAIHILKKLVDSNDILTIIDDGCIIQNNHYISEWFISIVNNAYFTNIVSVCLISRFRPNYNFVYNSSGRLVSFNVPPMSRKDIEKLFSRYIQLLGVPMNTSQAEPFIEVLNGIPAQVYYCVEKIRTLGISVAQNKAHIEDIASYSDKRLSYLIDELQNYQGAIDVLTLISNFEFISFNLLYKVIGRNDNTEGIMEKFNSLGIYELFGGSEEYIKPNNALSDYVKRAKFKIPTVYQSTLKNEIKDILTSSPNSEDVADLSTLLYSIRNAVLEGHKIPDKYYIPSFLIRSISELYHAAKYDQVIKIVDQLLENERNFDLQVIQNIRHYLCMSLIKEKDDRFNNEVQFFREKQGDYYFLLGFNFRVRKFYEKAENSYKVALEYDQNKIIKRELVIAMLGQDKYDEATSLARENYLSSKNNPYHIQAYFTCLIKKPAISKEDESMIDQLLEDAKSTHISFPSQILKAMQGEYEYYINKNYDYAQHILKEAVAENESKYYPVRALANIYKRRGADYLVDELYHFYKGLSPDL